MGGGYGGIYTALKLQKAARRGQIQLDLVSQDNFFLSQPMLSEVVSGSIEPTHIVNPIRRLLPHANFHQAEIQAVDTESCSVSVRYLGDQGQYRDIGYDYLVIAVGSSTDLSRLPGMAEHAFPFKTLGDAFRLRNHVIGVLEAADVDSDPEEKELSKVTWVPHTLRTWISTMSTNRSTTATSTPPPVGASKACSSFSRHCWSLGEAFVVPCPSWTTYTITSRSSLAFASKPQS